ncbi:MAG: hypothetical protein ACLFQB_13965 [Chitinispirillaceae bacterium]
MQNRLIIKLNLSVILLCFCASATKQEAVSDSSRYCELRREYAHNPQNERIIVTADALAQEGFYNEAAEILTSGGQPPPEDKLSCSWHISSGTDYSRQEDIDTAQMTPEEYQEYKRLTRTPLSVWLRGTARIDPHKGFLLSPQVHLSGYKSRLELPLRLQFSQSRHSALIAPKAEKWSRPDATGNKGFAPFSPYSSDMAGARVEIVTRNKNTDRFSWSLPGLIDWEHYREDRSGYESFIEYRTSPMLEYRHSDLPFRADLSGDLKYRDHYGTREDTLDYLEGELSADVFYTGKKFSAQNRLYYLQDRFINAQNPSQSDRLRFSIRTEVLVDSHFRPGISMQAVRISETHNDFLLTGKEFLFRPTVLFSWETLSIRPEFLFRKRWAEKAEDIYIWQASQTWESALYSSFSFKTFDLSLFAGYLWDDVMPSFETYTPDSRGIKTGLNAGFSFLSRWTVYTLVDYQYRIYAPYGIAGRRTENVTLSISLGAQF